MDDVVAGLLSIKRVREDCREAEMRRAQHQLDLAAEAVRHAMDAQQRRDRERAEREDALFEDVCSRSVKVRELNDLRVEIDTMKEAARADAQTVTEKKDQRAKRREALDGATLAWRAAAHAAQKFRDFAAQQLEIEAREMEWRLELELEEHPGRGIVAEAMQELPEEA
ncbi:MAG TPA: YscO family type III secretion system apparatus protein [Ramlibacter sp.]|uniref:type III secretion system stalk subunit SctO n=1 Tax=Ramlibacter sp. TaxID=1917967 RepID=UPI002BEC3F34|nr:YscO family type III secretion system apparatus protein [Ramlibacter sp.]HVZ45040.1 YscO family type III secretion system apparatus protein [Ramlibacter sp.]